MTTTQPARESRILRANQPIALDSGAWLVESGVVGLFVAPGSNGNSGTRRFLFSVPAGETILWRPWPHDVLAIALEEAVIHPISGSDVSEEALASWRQRLNVPHANAAEEDFDSRLETLQQEFFARVDRELSGQEADEQRRFEERQRLNRQIAVQTVSTLTAVGATSASSGTHAAMGEPPLLKAIRRVGDALGLTIRSPEPGGDFQDPLREILEASQARGRRVMLTGTWWREDCGPLLAFRADSQLPVALIPAHRSVFSRFRYLIYEGDAAPVVVDQAVARSLEASAWMIYAPLHGTSTFAVLRSALRGRSADIAAIVCAALAGTLLGMLVPVGTLLLFEHVIPDSNRTLLFQVGTGLVAAVIGVLVFDVVRVLSLMRLSTYAAMRIETGVWDRLLKQSPAFFRRFTVGDLGTRASTISQIRDLLNETLLATVFISAISSLNLLLIFYYSPVLALVALALAIVASTANWMAGRAMVKANQPLQAMEGELLGFMVQLIQAAPKLQISGAEARAFARWGEAFTVAQEQRQRIRLMTDRLDLFGVVLAPASSALLFWLAYDKILGTGGSPPSLSVGAFMAFNAAFGVFIAGAVTIGDSCPRLFGAVSLWKRMQPILDEEPEVDISKSSPGRLAGKVEIDHVTFRHRADGPLTLDDVSIHAEPGECIALVGPSGSGKSTIINLMLRFEKPMAGAVYLDGRDLAGLDIHAVRRQFGVVTQDNKIMDGTIYDNIVCGSLRTMEQALEAAREAGFADDIEQMPMGLHTYLSEGGSNISGGQRQRLLIARAIVQKPRILILDEATSALDNRTQAIVTESLDRLKVTRIIVAHRLSTVRNADRIYVIDSGRVVQCGTFEELLQQEGLFARLMRRQMA